MSSAPAVAFEVGAEAGPSRHVVLAANRALEEWLGRSVEPGGRAPLSEVGPELEPWVRAVDALAAAAPDVAVTTRTPPGPLGDPGTRLRALRRGSCLVVAVLEDDGTVDALRSALRDRDEQLRVLNHRVKNQLQVVSSFAAIELAESVDPDARAHLRTLRGRIHALALVHAQLQRTSSNGTIDLGEYVREIALATRAIHEAEEVPLSVDVDPLPVDVDVAADCGLLLHELLSDTFERACRDRQGARVQVRFEHPGEEARLTVVDDGPGLAALPHPGHRASLGLALVDELARKLGGEVIWKQQGGVRVEVRFPAGAPSEVARS